MMHDARIGPEGRDDALTRALRALIAPPADPAYWSGLEARILSLVAEEDAWWAPFVGWVRAGAVAAVLALAAAGVLAARARHAESQLAYRTVIETPRTLPQQIATQTSGLPEREATFRYVIAP